MATQFAGMQLSTPPTRTIFKGWITFWCALLVPIVFSDTLHAEIGIWLTGEIRVAARKPKSSDGTITPAKHAYTFEVWRLPGKWRFRLVDLDASNSRKRNFAHVERSFDGQDQYRIYHFAKALLDEQAQQTGAIELEQEQGEALPGSFPEDAGQHEKLIWLAFLSDITHLNPETRYLPLLTRPTMIGRTSVPEEMGRTRLEFALLSATNHLPSVLSGWRIPYRTYISSEPKSQMKFMRYPPPYDEETLSIRYSVDNTITVGGYTLPSEFRCEFFFLTKTDQYGQTFTNIVEEAIRGNVTDFKEIDIDDIRPRFETDALVVERRFRDQFGEVAVTQSKNEGWIERTNPSELNDRSRPKVYKRQREVWPLGENVLFYLMLVLLMAPPAILGIKRLTSKKHENIQATK